MPAYSFQQHFVPFVNDGSKSHTIRKRRIRGFAKKGDTLYLYSGLRTKWCKKLRQEICTKAVSIIITKAGSISISSKRMSDDDYYTMLANNCAVPLILIKYKFNPLSDKQKESLAYRDGFRTKLAGIAGISNFQMMMKWWRLTHNLPFIGDIIYWQPKNRGHRLKSSKN